MAGAGGRGNGRVSCGKRSEREQGREVAYKKVQVSTKYQEIRALLTGDRGFILVLAVDNIASNRRYLKMS